MQYFNLSKISVFEVKTLGAMAVQVATATSFM